jgi:hypothetical protein
VARDLRISVDGNSAGGQRALEEVAAASAAAAREADRMGDQFRQAERDAAGLDRQLAETAVAARALAVELAKNPADATLKKQLEAQRKAAAEPKRLRQDVIGDTERGAKEAARFAESVAADLEKVTARAAKEAAKLAEQAAANLKIANPGEGFSFGGAAPALGAVAAVPALAAAGGAALAGVGAIGAGAGVAAAVLGDPQKFQAEWSSAAGEVKKQFLDAGTAFVGPTLDAIETIGPLIDSWHLSAALAPAAKYVPVLVDGLERAATGLEHGIADAIAKSGPAVAVLSEGLAKLGVAAGDALSHIADGADGGAEALHDTLTAVSYLVEGFGLLTEGAEKAYSFIQDHPFEAAAATGGFTIAASLWSKALGDANQDASAFGHTLSNVAATATGITPDFAALAHELGAASVNADTLAGGMADKLLGSLLSADEATLGFAESLTRADETLKENKRNLDIHTAAGQADREAILGIVQANIKTYDTMIAAGATAVDAAHAYDQNTAALEANLRKAGLTQQAIDGLIGKYRSVPDRVNTNIAIEGLTNAINDLDDVLRRLNGLPPRKTINVNVVVGGALGLAESLLGAGILGAAAPKHRAMGGIRHAATGLIVGPSDPGTLIGEPQTGGEALIPLRGIAATRAASLARTAVAGYGLDVVSRSPRVPPGLFGGGGSSGPTSVTINFAGLSNDFERSFATMFSKMVRVGAIQLSVDGDGRVSLP